MNILVTGCNGQLGSELRRLLEARCPGQTTYIDREHLDLTDARAVEGFLSNNQFTHIINCAAYTAVDKAEEEKAACTAVNVDAVRNLAQHAEERGTRIIHISTDYVFDGVQHRPYNESDKPHPVSEYGATKRKGETALIGLAPDSIVIRTGWLYSSFGKNFVKTMLRLADERPAISVVADQVGTPTYAADLAKAIVDILHARQWTGGIYHYSNYGVCSWYDFAVAIMDLAGRTDVKVKPIPTSDYPTAAARPHYSVLDKSRISLIYGVDIPHWYDGLKRCLALLLAENK